LLERTPQLAVLHPCVEQLLHRGVSLVAIPAVLADGVVYSFPILLKLLFQSLQASQLLLLFSGNLGGVLRVRRWPS
jgi:hypothetical protein